MADDAKREATPLRGEGAAALVIDVAKWFGDRREVCLELDGVRYLLRITRRKKLILQK